MTFGGLKENSAADNFENSALTEDSLRLALSKLGSSSDRKRQSSGKSSNPFASGNSRSANTPTRRKFAREDSVVVEKLSPRMSGSVSRSVEKVRSLHEEKATPPSSENLQSLKQEIATLKEARQKSDEQQKLLENRLLEMDATLDQQAQMLMKLKELVTLLQPSFIKDEKEIPIQSGSEIFSTSQERLPNEPIPVTLKEDADPVEWWKN